MRELGNFLSIYVQKAVTIIMPINMMLAIYKYSIVDPIFLDCLGTAVL